MKRTLWIAATLALMGCENRQTLRFDGDDIWEYFPFNGDRTWTYQSTDTSIPYRLIGTTGESELLEDERTRVYLVEYTYDCLGSSSPCDVDEDDDGTPDIETEVQWTLRISSDSASGTRIFGYDDTTFDPPIRLASAKMDLGAELVTESGGTTFTSTYVEQVTCPAPYWGENPPEDCVHFTLDDGGAGTGLAGDYWSIYQFSLTAMQFEGEEGQWQLRDYDDQL